ncbi:MAG: helix-turn-helix domain-containing protein [Candidatus Baltobacteraceae bacterium]
MLAAAIKLMQAGKRPSVPEVAEAARISRRTAYRYFPSQEQLLTDAALDMLRPTVEASFASVEADPEARIDAAVHTMLYQAAANEDLLRTMIRLTIERGGDEQRHRNKPVRGGRRIDWIESALAPVRSRLSQRAFSRLVSAVALCVGAEALIVLRDVRGLDVEHVADVESWAARALVRAALQEAGNEK